MGLTTTNQTGIHGESGIGLVESIIGLLVLTIVLLAGGQLFRVQISHLALTERARRADTQANATMNSLAAYNQSALPDGNPFLGKGPGDPIADGEQLSLDTNACLTTYSCDQIARVPQSSGTGYDYITIGWNQSPPTGASVLYYRAWRVTTMDTAKHLRRITVAILPADLGKAPGDPIEPLALRHTDVVQHGRCYWLLPCP